MPCGPEGNGSDTVIVTCTPNPSLDRTVEVDRLRRGEVQRLMASRVHPGGKGVNVARVLHRNGHPTHAVVPVGGAEGDYFVTLLRAVGVPMSTVAVDASTRVNVTITESDGTTTKLNAEGEPLMPDACERLRSATVGLAEEDDWVAGCGSLPPGVDAAFYAALVERGRGAGCRTAVDASGPALAEAVAARPSLIKPNYHELSELTGEPLETFGDAVNAARGLCDRGVGAVLVSLGVDGALLVAEGEVLYGDSQPVTVRSTVGAGDALLAGFLAGGAAGADALVTGLAWATAACQLPGSIMPGPEHVDPSLVRLHDGYPPDRMLKGD
jgi:1-phosphofructokinase